MGEKRRERGVFVQVLRNSRYWKVYITNGSGFQMGANDVIAARR